jgi:hypothetical protein
MSKAHDLNVYSFLKYLLDVRPGKIMTDEQLEQFAPWNPDVKKALE